MIQRQSPSTGGLVVTASRCSTAGRSAGATARLKATTAGMPMPTTSFSLGESVARSTALGGPRGDGQRLLEGCWSVAMADTTHGVGRLGDGRFAALPGQAVGGQVAGQRLALRVFDRDTGQGAIGERGPPADGRTARCRPGRFRRTRRVQERVVALTRSGELAVTWVARLLGRGAASRPVAASELTTKRTALAAASTATAANTTW